MTIQSCLKQSSTGKSHEARVLTSAEITQCLMLPHEQLQERLQKELATGAHQQSRSTPSEDDRPAAPSRNTKVSIVTGLELLNLYSGELDGTTTSGGETEEASLESYCANSLKLAHAHLEGATDHHAVKTSRQRLIHQIAEEGEEDEPQQQDEASLGSSSSSSSSEDDFEDFCNDSFTRGFTASKQSVEGSLTAIPNLETYSCSGGMGRAA